MAKTYINASKNAGLKTNRITRKKKKEFINASARDEKNRGGLLEGAGYLLGSAGLGLAGVVEGAGDILSAGSDLLRGDTAMAKYRFMDNDTAEAQQKLTEWYNPNKAMQIAGDVSSGIGNSLVFMLPYVGPYLAAAGYTGMGISNAAEKTGDVGLKEIGYGAVSGGMEFALDKLTGGIGKASKNVGSAVARKLGREASESVAKATGKTAASKLAGVITGKTGRGLLSSVLIESGKGALGEAVEESLTEIIDPGLLKLFNIDENAELDWKQVAYAGLIGGLSGGLMTAGPAAVNYQSSVKAGRSIRESGQAESMVNYAKTTAINAATRKRERYKAAGEQKLTPKEDATVIGKTYTGAKNLVNSFQNSRAESRVKAMAEKVDKNVKAYESYMSNPKKTAKELEVSDAILGELRGNLFLLENATLLEVYEEAVLELDQEDKQNLVNDLNARAKEQKGKSDYTVADLEANTDDILTSIAAKYMTDDQYGELDRFFQKRKNATAETQPTETTPQAATQPAQDAEGAKAEQVPTQNKKPATANPDAIWEALKPEEGVEGFGVQNKEETDLLAFAMEKGVPKKSIPAMLDAYRANTTQMTPEEFAEGWNYGVTFLGRYNIQESSASPKSPFVNMDKASRSTAVSYGRAFAKEQAMREQKEADMKKVPAESLADARRKAEGRATVVKRGKGFIIQDLSKEQYSAYKGAEIMAPIIGADIVLEKSIDSKDGNQVNGFYDPKDNSIHVNISAVRDGKHIALYTLGHEVTHYVREWSPEKFSNLSDFVMEKLGGDAETLITDKLATLRTISDYQTMTDEALRDLAREEVVADGMELILTDGKVLDELARTDRSLWQRVKAWIQNIIAKIKKAYGDLNQASKTAQTLRETLDTLDEVERLFTESVREAGERVRTAGVETAPTENGQKLSFEPADFEKPITRQDVELLRSIGRKSINDFSSEDIEKAQKWAYKFYNEQKLGVKSPFFRAWFGDWRGYDSNPTEVIPIHKLSITERKDADSFVKSGIKNKTLYRGNIKNRDTGFEINVGAHVYDDTLTYANREYSRNKDFERYISRISILQNIKEIVEKSVLLDTAVINDADNLDRTFMHYFYSVCTINGKPNIVKLGVDELNANSGAIRRAYNVNNIEISPIAVSQVYKPAGTIGDDGENLSTISIADLFAFVKQYDKEFSPKPVNKLMLNEDGTPKVFYHGTNADFTVFDYGKIGTSSGVGILGDGFYFTDNKTLSLQYGKKVYECYVSIKNPYQATRDDLYKIDTVMLEKEGYDGVIFDAPNGTICMALDGTQIKSATDNIGTFDGTNPDIRYSIDSPTDPFQEAVQRMNDREQSEASSQETEDVEETETYTGEVLPPKVGQFRQKLANVLGTMIETTEEYRVLKDFEKNIAHLDHLQDDINELNDRAAKLREVQFGPYTDEERSAAAKQLQELYKQRNKLEDEMAEGDKKLTKLRQLAPVQNLLKREYEKQRETQKNIFETRYKSKQEAKETTEERRKVRRIYNRVHRILFSPNRKRGVPYEMTPLVAEALKTANMDVEAIQKLAELEEKLSALEKEAVPNEDKIAELEKKIMDQETLVAKMKDQTEFMVKLYEKTKDIKEGAGSLVFDETALEKLKALQEEIGNTAIRNMDKKQLKALKEFYNLLHKRITTANNTFATERTLKISDLGQKASTEAAESKPLKVLSPTGKEWAAMSGIRNFFWKNLKPLTVFEAIGSKTFADLFQNVLNGEDTWARDIVEAREKILKARETHGYKDWDLDERTEVQTGSGPVSLNLRERMALYALSFRENAESHLQGGGFVLDPMATEETKIKGLSVDALKKRLNDSKLYVMDKEMLGKLAAGLTKEQKEYVKEMQAYLTELGKKGNEVSRKLYGIDIFTEEFYFPMKVSSVYLEAQTGKTGDPNLKNMGMTKEIVPNAENPLVLQGFDEIMVDHINNMATYHAFVLPMEDLRRVLNYKPVNYKTDENGDVILNDDGLPVADSEAAKQYDTLQAVIESKYGQKANDYIIQLMRDLNGGARRDAAAGIIDRGITAFKRASTMASLSVLVQQPTSIFRAAAYIDPKYLFGNASIVDFKNHKGLWARVKKYAPVAIIKEIGGYDTGVGARTGDYLNAAEYGKGERLKGFATDANYRAEVFGMGAAYADEMAWIQIFEACVSEQADKLKQKRDSEAVLEAAGKRFEEVVRHTQVYDSTLTRSENMRSKDTGAKMATAFMSEPTTVVSMIAEGIMKAERGDVKFLRNTAGAVAASIIVNSLASSLVYALRDDDEEKTYGEKYISKLAMETAEGFNPLEYFPVFRDIMSMIKGYEIERTDMALVGDLLNQVQSLSSSKKTIPQKILGVSGAVASFFGLPLTNVVRDANGFRHTFLKLIDTERTERMTGKGLSVALKQEFDTIFNAFDEKTRNSYQLYQAVLDGDSKHFARVAARYESSKDAELALRQALREYDPRITEAALARINGDLDVYESLVDQIESEGKFDRNIAIRAINNQMTWIKNNDTGATVPQAEEAEDTPEALYTASDLNAALERGDAEDFEMLYYVLLTDKKEQGKTEAQAKSSIKSSVTSYWKKQYLAAWEANDTKEIKRIQSILLSTGLYGTRNDVATTGQEWVKAYAASKIKK